jgi:chromosome segregation ATPase
MKSRYQDAMNLSVDEVRPAKMLKPGVPPEEKDRAESDLQVAKQEVDHLQPSLTSATEAFEGAQRVAQEKNITYKDTKQGSHEVKDHQEKLARSKRKLDEAKREAAKDNKSEKKRVITAICSFLKKFTTEIENATNAYDRYMDATARQGGLRMSEDGLIAKKQELVFQLETMKQSTHDLEQAVLQKNTEFKYARNKVMESKEKADRLAPLGTDDNPSPLKLKFEEITGDRVELEGLISVLADRISRIIDNPAVLRNYKELKAQFDTQKEDFENLKDSKTTKRAELENLKVPYLAALTNIAKKVDELFGTYMAALGCKGKFLSYFCSS